MPYRVQVHTEMMGKIRELDLSDAVLVDVYIRLREELAAEPHTHLRRMSSPFDGLVYQLVVEDPERPRRVHFLFFHVLYGRDEQTLFVNDVKYIRTDNL